MLFFGGALVYYAEDMQRNIPNENRMSYSRNEEKQGVVENKEMDFTIKTNQGSVESVDGGFDDNLEGKIKTLPSLENNDIELKILPVPEQLEPVYLELHQ